MHLGMLIAKYREEENISMDDFANRSGLSKAYISMLEKNENSRSKKPIVPSLETIKAVADTIGLDFNEVIRLIDPDTKVSIYEPERYSTTINRLIRIMRELNGEGQQAIVNHAELLRASGKYDRDPKVMPLPHSGEKPSSPHGSQIVAEEPAQYDFENAQFTTYDGSELTNEQKLENLKAREEFQAKQEDNKK